MEPLSCPKPAPRTLHILTPCNPHANPETQKPHNGNTYQWKAKSGSPKASLSSVLGPECLSCFLVTDKQTDRQTHPNIPKPSLMRVFCPLQPDPILIHTICWWQGWLLVHQVQKMREDQTSLQGCTDPVDSSMGMRSLLSSMPGQSTCHGHCQLQLDPPAQPQHEAPRTWGNQDARSLEGSFLLELLAQAGPSPERHFASLLLIGIQSRQNSPQDLNAIFSLNYAKSFREGGEII